MTLRRTHLVNVSHFSLYGSGYLVKHEIQRNVITIYGVLHSDDFLFSETHDQHYKIAEVMVMVTTLQGTKQVIMIICVIGCAFDTSSALNAHQSEKHEAVEKES